MGPAREKTEKVMGGMETSADFFASWTSSNIELQAVFTEASRRTQEKIAEGLVGELRPDSYKDFYKIWMDTYSETFNEFLQSEKFSSDLGEVMSNWMQLQKFGRETMEEDYLKPMNLPTKADIDELGKEVYELKRSAREANRKLASLEAQVKELTAKSKPSTAKKKAPKKANPKSGGGKA